MFFSLRKRRVHIETNQLVGPLVSYTVLCYTRADSKMDVYTRGYIRATTASLLTYSKNRPTRR